MLQHSRTADFMSLTCLSLPLQDLNICCSGGMHCRPGGAKLGVPPMVGQLTFTLKRMTFSTTTSLSGMICFKATKHPAKTPSNPAISRYLRPTPTHHARSQRHPYGH